MSIWDCFFYGSPLTAAVALPLCAAIEFAQGVLCKETVGGIEWSFVAGDSRAVVGSSQILVSAIDPATEGDVVVPSTLGGYPVVGIDPYAFPGCEKLTSVTIPDGVTNIGTYAWRRCSALEHVSLPKTVPKNPRDVFTARIVMDRSEPVVTWSPDLSGSTGNRRVYRLLGKVSLDDGEWTPVAEGEADRFRFFRVSVMMP